jgi:hypothetical protein
MKHEFTMEARCAMLLRKEIEPILRRDDMDEDTAFSIIKLLVALGDSDKIAIGDSDKIVITIVPKYTEEHLI